MLISLQARSSKSFKLWPLPLHALIYLMHMTPGTSGARLGVRMVASRTSSASTRPSTTHTACAASVATPTGCGELGSLWDLRSAY